MYYESNEVAKRIKAVRISRGLTQDELAEKAGCGKRTIMRLEKGEGGTSMDVFVQVAGALDVSFDYLITGKLQSIEIRFFDLFSDLSEKDKDKLYEVMKSVVNTFCKR